MEGEGAEGNVAGDVDNDAEAGLSSSPLGSLAAG
jgi:hypothetical protein